METLSVGLYAASINVLFQFFIPFPTGPHQQTRSAKERYVPKLYDVSSNGFTCVDNGGTTTKKVIDLHCHNCFKRRKTDPEARSTEAAPTSTITSIHLKSLDTTPVWFDSALGKATSTVLKKSTDLSKRASQKIQNHG